MFNLNQKFRRRFAILCTVFFFVTFSVSPIFVPKANAQWTIVADIPAQIEGVLDFIVETLTTAGMAALINGTTYMARKLAYDAAVFVSEGGSGQGKLIYEGGVGDYFLSVTKDAAGEAVSGLGETFGLDLCQIPDPRISVFLQVGLRNIFPDGTEPKPKCSWQDLSESWGDIGNVLEERYGAGGSKLASHVFNANLSVTQSDFGVAAGAIGRVDENQVTAGIAANFERVVNKGVKDVVSLVSRKVETPAELVAHDLKALTAKEQQDLTTSQIAGLYGSSLQQIPAVAASTFLNTLMSKLLQKAFKGLFPSSPPDSEGGGGGGAGFFADAINNNRQVADRALGFLLSPKIGNVNAYNIADFFAVCPPSPSLNNCVMDKDLRQIVQRADQGSPLTIADAIKENLLKGDWPLISPRHPDNANVQECFLNKYCYSNIQKMRKVRMLPIGFELAALKSDPDSPWTLKQVVDGFTKCNARNTSDASNPFCRLIDPNWVIRLPQVRCASLVKGPILIDSNAPVRHEECADLQTCIDEADDGTCNNWGYCTREKNIWRLGGQECPAHYATCTTYTNSTDRSQVSFLSRTVDFGECSAQSVGCRAYSTEQVNNAFVVPATFTAPGRTALSAVGRNQTLFFNKTVQTCSSADEGCRAYYGTRRNPAGQFLQTAGVYQRDPGNLIHLKKAPDYLGCYDTNLATAVTEPPTTRAQAIAAAGNNEACSNFAGVCAPSEVGCEQYSQVGNTTKIPGIVSSNDSCDARCVGYETFRQEATNFEGSRFPVYFNPKNSGTRQCSEQTVGCEEFTNLEAGAQGGEQLQRYSYVRYCQKPIAGNEQTFFSWEGSESEGFVLRTHRLLVVNQTDVTYIRSLENNPAPNNLIYANNDTTADNNPATSDVFPIGSPAYNDTSLASLQRKYNSCNATSYSLLINSPFAAGAASADCRALYDNAGNIYYRLLSDTVTVSEQCIRLRKTDSRLYIDNAINLQNICTEQGGLWGDSNGDGANDCQRCFGGGRIRDGVCVYETIPAQSTQCAATAVGCRAYAGNTGNVTNPRIVYDNFEISATEASAIREAISEWTNSPDVRIASESLQVGGRSLQVDINRTQRVIAAGTLKPGQWYDLEFWARGTPQNLSITWAQDRNEDTNIVFSNNPATDERIAFLNRDLATNQDTTLTIGGEWRRYHLGPIQFTGDNNLNTVMTFDRTAVAGTAAGAYFLDFIRIGLLQDRLYLIKDSWQTAEGYDVPLVCDANPIDPFPGAALGCQAYNDTQGNQVFVTGFSSLCREAAIGCQPVFDSHNTVGTAQATVYNLDCAARPGTVCRLTVAGTEIGNCRVKVGLSTCNIAESTLPVGSDFATLVAAAPTAVTASTIYIPAESTTPVYLANRSEFRCRESQRGCIKLGLQDKRLPGSPATTISHTDTFVINDPEKYIRKDSSGNVDGGVLCREEVLGCGEFRAGGDTTYFKDPKYTGNTVCEYKTGVDISGAKWSGWFRKNIGVCSNNVATSCRENVDCGTGNTCTNVGSVPCYNNNNLPGNITGIWSNESPNYLGFVGECTAEENRCVELLDPLDVTAQYPAGQPYYRINDNRLTENVADCRNQVSLKEGCVLFDQTSQPTKIYSTALTYARSDTATPRYSFVDPVSNDNRAQNNANLLLKVVRDRGCAEWLACRNSIIVKNEENPQGIKLCTKYQACDQVNNQQQCIHYVDPTLEEKVLTEAKYASRNVSWFGRDYSGYSLLNRYQITDYVYLSFAGDLDQYLAYAVDDAFFSSTGDLNDPTRTDFSRLGCKPSREDTVAQREEKDGQPCGFDNQGRCYQDKCVYPIERTGRAPFETPVLTAALPVGVDARVRAVAENINLVKAGVEAPRCKAFPEDTSPFPTNNIVGGTLIEKAIDRNPLSPNLGASLLSSEGDLLTLRQRTGDPLPPIGGPNDLIIKQRRVFLQSGVSSAYNGANLCQGQDNCACEYNKYVYADGTEDYHLVSSTTNVSLFPDGICTGGEREGFPCEKDIQCNTPINAAPEAASSVGKCSRLKTKEVHNGLKGFCLEPDLSRPINGLSKPGPDSKPQEYACLTWLPIQTSASKVDLLNRFQEAGYFPVAQYDGPNTGAGGELYCASTDRGGFYDADMFPTNFDRNPATIARYYDLIFRDGGTTDRVVVDWPTCPSISNSVSASTLFPRQPTRNFLTVNADVGLGPDPFMLPWCEDYNTRGSSTPIAVRRNLGVQFMQILAWQRYGPNAHVAYLDPVGYTSPYVDGTISTLNARDIDRIYFIPVRYHLTNLSDSGDDGGNDREHIFPNFMNLEYFIDVDAVRDDTGSHSNNVAVQFYRRGDTTNFPIRAGSRRSYHGTGCLASGGDSPLGWGCFGERRDYGFTWMYRQENPTTDVSERLAWVFGPNTVPETNIASGFNDFSSTAPIFLNNISANTAPTYNSPNDPFNSTYANDCDGSIARSFDFDTNGNLIRVNSKNCLTEGRRVFFATIITYKNRCTEFVQVYNDTNPLAGTTNKAWTNRVWSNAQEKRQAGPDFRALPHPYQSYGWVNGAAHISAISVQRPFASVPLQGSLLRDVRNDQNRNTLLAHSFDLPGRDGIPYTCIDTIYPTNSVNFDRCPFADYSGTEGDSAYFNFNDGRINQLRSVSTAHARRALFQLFGLQFNRARLLATRAGYAAARNAPEDHTGDLGNTPLGQFQVAEVLRNEAPAVRHSEILRAPRIFSLNPATCFTQGSACTAAEVNSFTVNQRNQVTPLVDYDNDGVFDEDDNRDGFPDAIIGQGARSVNLQFFGMADDNRMPLRQVTVDWRDGEISNDGVRGLYKNRKPFCDRNDSVTAPTTGLCEETTPTGQADVSNLTCRNDADCPARLLNNLATAGNCLTPTELLTRTDRFGTQRFGNTPRACVEQTFEFVHDYVCQRATVEGDNVADYVQAINTLPEPVQARLAADYSLTPTDRVCVFRPRVQLTDNWGYCNGVCNNPRGLAGNLCYNGEENNRASNECDYSRNDPANNPWTDYRGLIIVVPPAEQP